MAKYSIAQVENLTGINAHTLRKWEDRYQFIQPERTSSNIRFYTDDMLRMLLNVAILVRHGYKISAVDRMDEHQINQRVAEYIDEKNPPYQDLIDTLIGLTLTLEEELINQLIEQQVNKHGVFKTMVEIIYPFLRKVGLYWSTSQLLPAQERFVTNLIRHKLILSIDSLPAAKDNAPEIVLFLPEGEWHELGLLLAHFLARSHGWRVIYLGQNVPVENVLSTMEISKVFVVMTILTSPIGTSMHEFIRSLQENNRIEILITGSSPDISRIRRSSQMVFFEDLQDYIQYLEEYKSA